MRKNPSGFPPGRRRRSADMRKSTPAGQISVKRANVSRRHSNGFLADQDEHLNF